MRLAAACSLGGQFVVIRQSQTVVYSMHVFYSLVDIHVSPILSW